MKMTSLIRRIIALGIACFMGNVSLHAQLSAFTCQGVLSQGGQPANGAFDMQFLLFDAASSGGQIGSTATNVPVTIADGLFNVSLDFGAGAFEGSARWLEIRLRAQGSSDPFTTLTPR
jgi:hypothetical protein